MNDIMKQKIIFWLLEQKGHALEAQKETYERAQMTAVGPQIIAAHTERIEIIDYLSELVKKQ